MNPTDRMPLEPSPIARADATVIRLFFGSGAAVAAIFALLYGLSSSAAAGAAPGPLMWLCSALSLCFVLGGLVARRAGTAAPAVLACCWATLLGTTLLGAALGQGVRALPLGFMAVIIALGWVVVGQRAGLALAAGSALLLGGLAGAEGLGWFAVRATTSPAPALIGHLLLVLTGMTSGAVASHVLGLVLQAAREREQRFKGLLDIAADWYWEQDSQFRFTHISDKVVDDSGVPAHEHLGRTRWEIPELELTDAQWAAHRADLEAHHPFRELVLRRPDAGGTPRFVRVSGEPVFDADGTFKGYWGVGWNVTETVRAQRELQASEERYRQLFALSPSPMVVHRSAVVIDANEAAARLFGYDSVQAMHGVDMAMHHPEGPERDRMRARVAEVGALAPQQMLPPAEYPMRALDGRPIDVQVASMRAALPGGPATLTIYADLTELRAADRARREAQALIQTVLLTSPDVITLTDVATGRYLLVNERFLQLTGYEESEVIERSSTELGLWADPADRDRLVAALREQGQVQHLPLKFRVKDGRILLMLVSAAVFQQAGREYIVTNGHDATDSERERLERDAILQNASIGIALTRGQQIVHANPRFESMFGWSPGTLAGQPYGAVWPADAEHPGLGEEALPALARGALFEVERPLRRSDGSLFWCRVIGQAIDRRHPGEGGTIWIAEDVTERRETARELAAARDAAEAANQAKSAFLANTSHEIRTPLNALLGLARLAREPGEETTRRQRYLDQILESAQGLSAVISDILDFSKIEAGKLALETLPFALHDSVAATCRGFEALAEADGLTLALHIAPDVPAVVRGDPLRVRQILGNFLGNALKFTAQGGVCVELERAGGDEVLLRVIDTGVGIDAATQARLFRPFTQADDSITRRHGGTGLGLSICRELAQLMGGEVGVDSAPGQGSSFWARLPLPEAAAAEVGPREAGDLARHLAGARVLLVEDNPVNMMIAAAMLEQWQVVVTQAGDGQQAIDAVARAEAEGLPFDAVLMDVQMPVMSGHEAARRLRQTHSSERLPIIALTAAALVAERDQALAAGMDVFLTKPIDIEQLQRTLARVVAGREAVPSVSPPMRY